MSAVWDDVKGRKIFKAATLYAAVAWGIIQISDILLPVLRYPDWVMSSMVLVAFSGFPIALIIGWLLDIRNERKQLKELSDIPDANNGVVNSSSIQSRLIEFTIILVFGGGATLLYLNSAGKPVKAGIGQLQTVQQLVTPSLNQKTIAVLPFASFGNNEQDDFFADGLSEELLNVLAKNKDLRVAARTSSFQYKNQNINVRKIARELGVQYILEGSVRRSGEQIRVTAQLIKADEDVHVFSSTWDKDTNNIFKVQDEIAQSVLETLEVTLLGKTTEESSDIGTLNIAAFAEYSRGVAFVRSRSKSDFTNAIKHLNNALEIDPDYAEANAMLAQTYLLQLSYDQIKKSADAFELAKPNIDRAFKLNGDLPEAHAVSGLYNWQLSNMLHSENKEDEAKKALELAKFHLNKAIELNPSNAEAYMWYGSILQKEGQIADGSKLYKKAFEIDPQAAVVGFNRGSDLVNSGHFAEAMEVFNTIVRNNPNYANAYHIAGNVSYAVGQLDQAYSMYKRVAELSGDDNEWLFGSFKILMPLGEWERAQQNLDKIAEIDSEKIRKNLPQLQAQLWIASEEYEKFNQWVESFDENTTDWGERLWRGFSALGKKDYKFATSELSKSLELSRKDNDDRKDQLTIRIQLLLAKAWQQRGNALKAENYLDEVQNEMNYLVEQKIVRESAIRYFQAAHALLSKDTLRSLGLIRQAVQEGFVNSWMLQRDPTFEAIQSDPTFQAILRELSGRMRLMRQNILTQEEKLALGR